MKKTTILLLVLVLVGVYYAPAFTKKVAVITGHAVADAAQDVYHGVKETEEIQEKVQLVKDAVNGSSDEDNDSLR